MKEKTRSKFTLGAKFGYATGDILGGGAFALLSLLFLNFLVTVEGIPATLAGTIVMLGKVWDAVSDPLMGIITDKTKSRFGRRRIYIIAGVIPVFASFVMLWCSFGLTTVFAKFIYYSVSYILFSTAFTLVMVPYNALLPDMVDSYKDRTSFSTIRMLVSNIAALTAVVVPPLLLGSRAKADYLKMGIIFAAFFALPLIVTFFTTWENAQETENTESMRQMLVLLKNSFQNKAYRQYLGIFICGQMATDVVTTLMAFWLADVLNRSGMLSLMSGLTMLVAVLLLPFNNFVAKKYGKHLVAVIEQPFRIAGLVLAFFLGAKSPFVLLIAVCVLGGIGGSASAFVPWSLLPDLPDTDEMICGRRNAGIYAGASTFVRKFTSGFSIFIIGVALQGFGYVESLSGAGTQSATALLGVRVLFCFVPIMLTIVTMLLAKRYTLTIENHKKVRMAIDYKKTQGMPIADKEVIAACEKVAGRSFDTMWVGK